MEVETEKKESGDARKRKCEMADMVTYRTFGPHLFIGNY
jgi:hypothetical protein